MRQQFDAGARGQRKMRIGRSFFSQLDATPIETNLNQYIVHENGIKLRVTQALVAVGLYKPLRNAVRKLRRR